MSPTVRDFRPSDALAVAVLRRAALPAVLATPRGLVRQLADAAPEQRMRCLVAEREGRVIGAVTAHLVHDSSVPGTGSATPHVHPDHRWYGAGGALLTAAEEHLAAVGAERIFAWVDDAPGPLAFAERRGYRPTRPAHFLRLDLADAAPPPGPLPPGVALHTGADLAGDPAGVFAADAETAADEPGDVPCDAMTYPDWLRQIWGHPDHDPRLTTVVTVGGEVAAFTLAATDGLGRYSSAMTGTRRAHRGRGLARLAKAASLQRAREAGCTEAFTGNDAANAPMLAVNRALGYRPYGSEWRCVRELEQG
ncbi:GNAT family N-acetyltransferase [Streptomyces catenulae]|uniref:GNAT family N-acetyltransferase n=1 Tax=Streptomyces catenulae TaxID=66875 RepID=A0ABV2Z2K3_9ACTN|nr:GNAT family N-acetyltransferase [Streptomyces catenulae]